MVAAAVVVVVVVVVVELVVVVLVLLLVGSLRKDPDPDNDNWPERYCTGRFHWWYVCVCVLRLQYHAGGAEAWWHAPSGADTPFLRRRGLGKSHMAAWRVRAARSKPGCYPTLTR